MDKISHSNLMAFTSDQIKILHQKIETPALLVAEDRMDRNILYMQTLADENYSWLRPHIKTHKSVDIANRQLTLGAPGVTVAKLSEAEVMRDAGINDIFIASQITHPLKIQRLRTMHNRGRIIAAIDNEAQIDLLKPMFENALRPLEVRIEIDSGLHRCGVNGMRQLVELAQKINEKEWLILEGIFTHAGQAYAAKSEEELIKIGTLEGKTMEKAHDALRKHGMEVQTISVGSTPTVKYSVKNEAVNEIRPGNYIFYDGIQLALGSTREENCSLFVLATIISQPAPDRVVIDAGSKALNLDRGAHSSAMIEGFGTPLNVNGCIQRVSEEHGVIILKEKAELQIGSPVIILPNHACTVVNLYERYYLISERLEIETINISARGKSQ
jgi:D-serine deaminase-like pyridoxal phosphate-dependent protein